MRQFFTQALLFGAMFFGSAAYTAQAAEVSHYLYLLNDVDARIDIFDLDNGHKKVHSFDVSSGYTGEGRYRGLTAHAGTSRLYISESDNKFVAAYDILTEKMIWKKNYKECTFPDRLTVSKDGTALYIPCRQSPMQILVVSSETGELIKSLPMDKSPHNSFTGESGRYMYMSSQETMVISDANTHEVVKEVSGFKSPIRPFTVDPEEQFFFANLTDILGFGVGGIENEKKMFEITVETPAERTKHKNAAVELSHGGAPKSHGIALRPGTREVWFLDDAWGYLYVFDTSPLYEATPGKPVQIASVPLFTDVTKKWTKTRWRWVNFSADGKYVYPGSGIVVDAEAKQMTDMTIPFSEKFIGIEFTDGKPSATGGQNGGYYPL
jgi:DNA-binding beta-propeller fold protein YncE